MALSVRRMRQLRKRWANLQEALDADPGLLDFESRVARYEATASVPPKYLTIKGIGGKFKRTRKVG